MKNFRLSLALTSSLLSAYSPVTWAGMDLKQKSKWNQELKKTYSGTYNDFYRKNGWVFDKQSRGIIEGYLAIKGKSKVPTPQAQIIKDKNGNETLQMVITENGKNLTVLINPKNRDEIQINGTKITKAQSRHIPDVIDALAEKDSSYKETAKELRKLKTLSPKRSDMISITQFSRLKPIDRVAMLSHIRLVMEASQKVMEEKNAKKKTAEIRIVPWIMETAWADGSVAEGDQCIVAGHISVYEYCKGTESLCCTPRPLKNHAGKIPDFETFHGLCDSASGGDTACNPLIYGARPPTSPDGKWSTPYCLQSTDQPTFSAIATEKCGGFSQLGAEGSAERRKAYRDILESYYKLKNRADGDAIDKLKNCFNEENKVNAKCAGLFQHHLAAFKSYYDEAMAVCKPIREGKKGAWDQPHACDELEKRSLDMINYLEDVVPAELMPNGKVGAADAFPGICENDGLKWDPDLTDCFCPDGSAALYDRKYTCPERKVVEKADEGSMCKDEDGNLTFWCVGVPLVLLGLSMAWLDDDDHKGHKPNPGPVTPPPPGPVTPPKSEGGTGSNDANAGGVSPRGTGTGSK